MKKNKHLLKYGLLTGLIALNSPVNALDKPQTMEDMWKIIQAQQKQIDEMKSAMPVTPVAGEVKIEPQPVAKTSPNELKTLERKTDVLTQEVEKLRTNLSIPEEAKYKSAYGMGPAASKVYGAGKGLSIGGYGEGNYSAKVGDKGSSNDSADMERMVMYVGYKFTDNILFNSEIEFEHGSTGEGSETKGEVSVEFASLDFFIDQKANARAGLVLMPMGLVNRIHEPLFYFGNHRPEVEQRIIPSTWREMGAGLFGAITPNLTYTAYVVNGLDASGFTSDGMREARGGGSNAKAENFGYVARVDYDPDVLPGVTVGGSAYVGNSGQNQLFAGQKVNAFTQLYETHLQWKYRGLEFRSLGSLGYIGDAGALSAANIARNGPVDADHANAGQIVGSQNYGWYSEAGYDVLPILWQDTSQYLAPFFRYERLNTMAKAPSGYAIDRTKDWQIFQFGLQYKPIPNVVIKADYRNYVAKQGQLPDDFNLGFGFIF
jgi:hypothetical protein